MLFSTVNDNKLRNNYLKTEYKNKINKFIFINAISKLTLTGKFKKKVYLSTIFKTLYLKLFNKRNNKIKMVPHCLITGRTKSVYKKFNLSRSVLRDLIQFGLVPGYKKAVW